MEETVSEGMRSRDPVQDSLESELWALRTADETTWDGRLATRAHLVDAIGGGSIERARRALMEIRRRHGADAQSDIAAYFASAGWKTQGDTLDKRLDRYAARVGCVSRTARRRSDRGATQVARLIREGLHHDRPWARIVVQQSAGTLNAFLIYNVAKGSLFTEPSVYVNGRQVTGLDFSFKPSSEGRLTCIQPLAPIKLDDKVTAAFEPLALIVVSWVPRIAATWDLVARLADDRLFARLSLDPFPTVVASVAWWSDSDGSKVHSFADFSTTQPESNKAVAQTV